MKVYVYGLITKKGLVKMLNLIPIMFEKVGIIVIVAFLLSQMKSFRQLVHSEHKIKERITLILLFGAFGIISNYTGIEIYKRVISDVDWLVGLDDESALANTRVMGTVIAGLLGGRQVGLGAGLIAGIHRYSLGGFTAFACSISTVIAGFVAGYIGKIQKQKGKPLTPGFAVLVGMSLEALQMILILLLAKPFEAAWTLVQIIGVPMVVVNGIGTLLFMLIILFIRRDEERTRANQTNLAFHIADQTLPFFREGLNSESCKKISEILLKVTNADAVAITDTHQVLSHVGAGADHHIPKGNLVTGLTKKVLESGRISTAKNKDEIFCIHRDCPLEGAIVLPLKVKNKVVGTFKMYYTQPEKLDKVQQQLAEGLANLFSTQMELAEAEHQTKLLRDAEIKALQAQIHPHFLFNSLNTISVLCRTDPEKARDLLLELSSFFRGNLQGARQMLIPLCKELENVKAYLSLEQTRFPNKYNISFEVDPNLEQVLIPPFTLQPLVENAINYSFPRTKHEGKIKIRIFVSKNKLNIIVEDNGKGIQKERIKLLGTEVVHSEKGNGTALFNISERLNGIYSGQARFLIESKVDVGTKITISIPFDRTGGLDFNAESLYSG